VTCTSFKKEMIFYCFFLENVKRRAFSRFSVALLSVSESTVCSSCPSTRIIAVICCQFDANGKALGPLLEL